MNNYYYNHQLNSQDYKERERDMFLRKYEAQASLSSHKMYAVREPFNYSASYDVASLSHSFQVRQEPCVEMFIPQHKFNDLIENEKYIRQLEEDYRHLKGLERNTLEDARIRDSNPTVKKAWEKYLTLLELVRK